MDVKLAIDKDVLLQHLDVLVIAHAAGCPAPLDDHEIGNVVNVLWARLLKIGQRFLSDSPNIDEKRRFTVAVLQDAVAIAEGKVAL